MATKRKLILKFFAFCVVVPCVVILVFALMTLWQLPLERLERYPPKDPQKTRASHESISLQAGAFVARPLLKTYWLFSASGVSFERWVKSNKKHMEVRGERVLFKSDLPLVQLLRNQCEVQYCYQRRMSFEKIPSVFWKGLIGIEDARFLDHKGVDFRSIARAVYEDIKAMSLVQGGSTITQQLVKNLYFNNDKSFKRKIQEVFVSLYLERRYPKENILEAYFNEVFWGSLDGIRIKGLFAASLFYFAKKPNELSSFEAAILISMLKGPSYYHPLRHIDRLKRRVGSVYKRLKKINIFYGAEEVIWKDAEWLEWQQGLRERTRSRRLSAIWRSLKAPSDTLNEFDRLVFIHQSKRLEDQLEKSTQGADIAIKAVVKDLERPEAQAFSYYSKYERSLEEAIHDEKHQVGSLLKPILYGVYLKLGLKLDDKVSSAPLTLNLKSGPWSPKEAARKFPEELSVRRALQRSLNRPVVRLAKELGFQNVQDELIKYFPDILTPLKEYPAQLLGALELSLDELAGAYEKFIVKACQDAKLSQILWTLSDPLLTTLVNQVDESLAKLPFFGKTGTSNKGLDNLFISYDGRLLSLIWVGLEGSRKDKSLPLYGSTTAFQLYQNFVLRRGTRFGELSCGP